MEAFVNQIVQGVLLGGLYALFALGLSLSVGIMRFVNIAHGDLIVLASFALLSLATTFGGTLLPAMLLLVPLAFAAGFALQRFLLQRVVGGGVLPVILVTFGLSVIIQNGLLEGYGADTRKLSVGDLETATLALGGGISVGVLPLLIFVAAVVMVILLDTLLYRTRVGARIRAVADDVDAADLIGLSSPRIFATAMAVIGVTVAVAACFMAVRTNFDPASGPSRLLIAFEAVVLGGLGSLWGTLAGGILLGVAQSIGAHIDPGSQMLAGHLLFLLVLVVRPQGLFPR
jgi:branched-chain amino acid transport system permease protein